MERVIDAAILPDGLVLSYAAQGDETGPAVVLLPGPTDSWRSYERVLDQLTPTVRAIAVSQRGHGDSGKPDTGYRVEDFAGDVVPLLDVLGIERAFLVGHSGSCLTVRRVALDHAERVAGLVLEASPTSLAGHPGLTTFVREGIDGLEDPIDPAFARSIIADTSSGDIDPAELEMFTAELLKVPARVWHEMFGSLLTYDDASERERIDAPTLLLWGDADQLVDRVMQDDLAATIRGAELVVYPGIGHTPRWEDPARFAGDVAAFAHARWHHDAA